MSEDDKVRENKARRAAGRQGLQVVKSRRRDPRAWDYGLYMLTDARTSAVVVHAGESESPWLTLDQLEAELDSGRHARQVAR